MTLLLLAPFAVFCALAFGGSSTAHASAPVAVVGNRDWIGGLLVAMWNFMGWDNASTVAGEVDRPQRNYPLAMLGALAMVMLTYLVPVAAAARSGLPPEAWTTGAWVQAGQAVGGPVLAVAIVAGGLVCGLGMMDALVMSYSRLPMVMAQEGLLPKVFARQISSTGAPWVAIVVLSLGWCAALGLGFERLVEIDVVLYGIALVLEFVALVVLRIREPELPRPFRVPGGMPVAVLLGVCPAGLLGLAFAREWQAHESHATAIALAVGVVVAGPGLYGVMRGSRAPTTIP
jgi:amino acid transporter